MTDCALRPARVLLLAALLGSGLTLSTASLAQVSVNIAIGVPPPAPIYEAVPAPRAGYVWVPGYWDWDDHYRKHAWKKGRWERERPGYVYESPRWIQSRDGWVLVPGRWDQGGYKDKGKDKGNKGNKGHQDHGGKGNHCPPGQAKKGEC